MNIVFDRGSEDRPKGHALMYFKGRLNPDEIWVTYLVILPITVDISKYVPPFLMSQVGDIGPKDLSAFAFPPAPEKVEGMATVTELAERRDDDIIFAGSVNPSDIASAMMTINEAVQRYADMYTRSMPAAGPRDEGPSDLGVNDVIYGLMSEGDKLGELTKLVGRLRFAHEGKDANLVQETEEEIRLLARHLPDNHNVPDLINAVKTSDRQGMDLANLYLQRCYHLVKEEYAMLGKVEEQIRSMKGE